MKKIPLLALIFISFGSDANADRVDPFRTLYRTSSVETDSLKIVLEPLGDGELFSITLSSAETGAIRRHVFEGEGANDPSPFLLRERVYCGTSVILLTIEYPYRHELPQPSLVLDTYAFRREDFAFIDVVQGPLTDIALQDDGEDAELPVELLPPVGVHCQTDPANGPLKFFRREAE